MGTTRNRLISQGLQSGRGPRPLNPRRNRVELTRCFAVSGRAAIRWLRPTPYALAGLRVNDFGLMRSQTGRRDDAQDSNPACVPRQAFPSGQHRLITRRVWRVTLAGHWH